MFPHQPYTSRLDLLLAASNDILTDIVPEKLAQDLFQVQFPERVLYCKQLAQIHNKQALRIHNLLSMCRDLDSHSLQAARLEQNNMVYKVYSQDLKRRKAVNKMGLKNKSNFRNCSCTIRRYHTSSDIRPDKHLP